MKTPPTTILLTLIAAAFTLSLRAQESNTATPPLQPPPPGAGKHGPMAILSEEERVKVKAAHDAAIQKDPSLEKGMKEAHQAMEKARQAMNDAMIAVDPAVEPILAKIVPQKRGGCQEGKNPGKAEFSWKHQGSGGEPKGMANLSENERRQLKALHAQVKNDPAVMAAHEAMQSAGTPEARHAAEEALHKAAREAMIKIDPSIEPILEKLHPAGRGNGGDAGQSTNAETPPMQAQ